MSELDIRQESLAAANYAVRQVLENLSVQAPPLDFRGDLSHATTDFTRRLTDCLRSLTEQTKNIEMILNTLNTQSADLDMSLGSKTQNIAAITKQVVAQQ